MGRQRRVSLARIPDDKSRNSCFSKRKLGLFSKAFELGELCGCEMVVVTRTDSGQFHAFGNTDMRQLIHDFLATQDKVKCMTSDDIERVRYIWLSIYFILIIICKLKGNILKRKVMLVPRFFLHVNQLPSIFMFLELIFLSRPPYNSLLVLSKLA